MYLVRIENQLIIVRRNVEATAPSRRLTPTNARRIAIVTIHETNWFSVREDTNTPIAIQAAPMRSRQITELKITAVLGVPYS